jgi:hypothetical protein
MPPGERMMTWRPTSLPVLTKPRGVFAGTCDQEETSYSSR